MSAQPEPTRLATLQVRLRPEQLERIDKMRVRMPLRPTRSQMIRFLLVNAMTILEEAEERQRKTASLTQLVPGERTLIRRPG
jgi:hypothetical protein